MRTVLTNGRVLTGEGLRDDVAVILDGDRIADLVAANAAPDGARVDLDGGTLLPGAESAATTSAMRSPSRITATSSRRPSPVSTRPLIRTVRIRLFR